MRLGKNKSFLKEYAKSSYMNKINPEDEGVAKRYYNEKREHAKIHNIKDKLNKEVAYIERMEKNLQNTLQKKRREFEFTKEVNNRIISDCRRVRSSRRRKSGFRSTKPKQSRISSSMPNFSKASPKGNSRKQRTP